MTAKPVALPPQLHACVNEFLTQANDMRNSTPYDGISASILYAAARFNVNGFLSQGADRQWSHKDFVAYMTDLYRRMLEEQLDVLGKAGAKAAP